MPNPAIAVGGLGVGTSLIGANQQRKAAEGATAAQVEMGDKAIAEQRRQFDKYQEVLAPYVESGELGLAGMLGLSGLKGAPAQQEQIDLIRNSPEFKALSEVGQEAILANASATGGLRGGNVQGALARFEQQNLSDLINKQMSRFGGIAQLGQASAAGTGSAALQTGANVSNILGNQGEAIGQGLIARGNVNANVFGDIGKFGGQILGGF